MHWTIELLVTVTGTEDEANRYSREVATMLREKAVTVVIADVRADEERDEP